MTVYMVWKTTVDNKEICVGTFETRAEAEKVVEKLAFGYILPALKI